MFLCSQLVVECTAGHGCTHYTAHRKPKGYTESFYICDVCRKNTTFNHEFWHCDECVPPLLARDSIVCY